MAKFSNDQLNAFVNMANELNYKGKRLAKTRFAVCEEIAAAYMVDAEKVSAFLQREKYTKFWSDYDAKNGVEKKKRVSNKLAADTMTGSVGTKIADMQTLVGERFIITSAQNNTSAAPVFDSLVKLAEQVDARLVVLPVYYNKNAFSPVCEDENERSNFDVKIQQFIQEDDCWIGEKFGIRLCPTANVLPTAKLPVNSAAMLNAGELATIVPSPKQQMITLPRLNNAPIKEAWSTGTCTVYNYVQSRAGSEAEIEHRFGGLLVTVLENGYDVTNLVEAVDGSIMIDGVDWLRDSEPCLDPVNMVLGDLHCEMQDVEAYNKTLAYLEHIGDVDKIAVHDILHFDARSHHNRHSGKHLYKMQTMGRTVKADLVKVIEQVNELATYCNELYIVESNHNSAIDNWLDDSSYSPQTDPQNAKLWYLVNYAVCEMIDSGFDKPALEVVLADMADLSGLPPLAENVVFGRMDETELWNGYDVSQHGHKGQNGSAGNSRMFNKWRLPMVTGHTHSPAIFGDCYTVGVMAKLNQGYNRGGASSWNQGNMIIQSNNTVQFKRVNLLSK